MAPAPTSTARTVRCSACGGDVRIEALAQTAQCPYCQSPVAVPPELQQQLAQYRAALLRASQAAADQRDAAAAARRIAKFSSNRFMLLAVLLVAAPTLAVALGIIALTETGALPQGSTETWLPVATTIVALVGVAVFIWTLARGGSSRDGRLALGTQSVACPTCGGRNEHVAGQLGELCRYCQSAIVPSSTVMNLVVEDAARAVRRERLLRYRADRAAQQRTAEELQRSLSVLSWFGLNSRWSIGWKVVVGVGVLVAVTLAEWDSGGAASLEILAAWGGAVGIALIAALVTAVAWSRRRRVDAAFRALASQFGGAVLPDVRSVRGWHDALWAGPLTVSDAHTGKAHRAVSFVVAGYHGMLEFQPHGTFALPGGKRARLVIYLAADVPGASETAEFAPHEPGAQSVVQWLRDADFEPAVNAGGLVARAGPSLTRRCRSEPEVVTGLAPVLSTLAQLARATGASRVEPEG